MTEAPSSGSEARDGLVRAVGTLKQHLPTDSATQLIDFVAAGDSDLEEMVRLAQERVATVVLRLRYETAYRGAAPPSSAPQLDGQVLAHAANLVSANVRAADLVLRVGPVDLAVLLLQAGPLHARAQAGRLRAAMQEQRLLHEGYEIRWRGRLALATYEGGNEVRPARQLLETLFNTAS